MSVTVACCNCGGGSILAPTAAPTNEIEKCTPTSVPFSDHSVPGSVTGFINETVEVTCIDGYSGGGKKSFSLSFNIRS